MEDMTRVDISVDIDCKKEWSRNCSCLPTRRWMVFTKHLEVERRRGNICTQMMWQRRGWRRVSYGEVTLAYDAPTCDEPRKQGRVQIKEKGPWVDGQTACKEPDPSLTLICAVFVVTSSWLGDMRGSYTSTMLEGRDMPRRS